MKININHRIDKIADVDKLRVESEDWIFDLSVDIATGNLTVKKIDGEKIKAISIFPRESNEIWIS